MANVTGWSMRSIFATRPRERVMRSKRLPSDCGEMMSRPFVIRRHGNPGALGGVCGMEQLDFETRHDMNGFRRGESLLGRKKPCPRFSCPVCPQKTGRLPVPPSSKSRCVPSGRFMVGIKPIRAGHDVGDPAQAGVLFRIISGGAGRGRRHFQPGNQPARRCHFIVAADGEDIFAADKMGGDIHVGRACANP